ALQFAQTGNADAAIVALSLAVAPPVRSAGRYWVIPSDLHRPIRQAAGITTTSRRQPLAEAFLDFVTVGSGREVLRQYGFGSPPEQP
ncbi:MAG TPA: molybdate ABC transporter substrate-binding protein, partial [bacterium]|nr:molybdate ABC transporter substrate-binding protein [bacterium]